MANSLTNCGKGMKMCATCMFWGGWRRVDSLGSITFDMSNNQGRCNQVGWKGFSGATTMATMECPDYQPLTQ